MNSDLTPIRRRKLADEVQERLLDLLQAGDLKPGDLLPSERELMSSYGVGRPAIREAMQNLQRMGLVDIRHGERPCVAEPSMDSMVDLLAQTMRHMLTHSDTTLPHLKEARVTFESEMARIAARKRTDDDLVRLRDVLKEQRRVRREGADGFMGLDGEFHRTIASISGNPIFEWLSQALFGWLTHFHDDLVRKPGMENLTIKEHKAILDAIALGDADAAGKHMTDHLNRANSLYQQDNLRT